MPKLWDETIEEHRKAVHKAILDTTAALVAEHGLTSVTMSQIAQATRIGRATLYKYFADVEAIMMAWHERQVTGHLRQLVAVRDQVSDPERRLHDVLHTYALIRHEHHGHDLAPLLHRGQHMDRAGQHLRGLVAGLLADAAADGHVRDDIASSELADYCLHALAAAGNLRSKAAVGRLVTVTLAGLRPPRHATQRDYR